jgi:rare lipoprotein A
VTKVEYGVASWYGKAFHGRPTASGETFDMSRATAAHKHAPLGTHAVVTNLDNGQAVRVRINDRGPVLRNRILDLSYGAARSLDMVETGIVRVKVEFLPEPVDLPQIFTVQAGSFHDPNNAARAHKALGSFHPRVWVNTVRESVQTLYRVLVGPFSKREDAERVARQVEAQGYTPVVVSLPH